MKRVANHKVFKTVMAWLLALVVLVTTVTPSLTASADNEETLVDYSKMSVEDLLKSEGNLTWVFAGDSITHNATFTAGMNGYGEWFEQYLNGTGRDKDSVIISAWGGADVFDFQTAENEKNDSTLSKSGRNDYPGMGIENMVTKYNPDVVFIKLGMNDRYKTTEQYKKYYNQMIDSILDICKKDYGKTPKIVLLTPTPTAAESVYDDMNADSKVEANWDSTLRHCEAVQEIAEERNFTWVNLREAFMNAQLELGDDYFATFFRDPSDGGIHPNAAGQYIMFKKLAQTLGIDTTSDPIFQYEYEDFLAGELYTDVTKDVTYVNAYDTVTATSSKQEQPELLASIDFTSENGAFNGAKTYADATRIDLTDENVCDDPLTLEEARSLKNEFSVVFRAKLSKNLSATATQAVLFLSTKSTDWKDALALGVPSNKTEAYYAIRKGNSNLKNGNNGYSIAQTTNEVNANVTTDGTYHTIAVVQSKNAFSYYVDGKLAYTDTKNYVKEGSSIGDIFAGENFLAYIGSFSTNAGTYNLAADMDFYQLYKGALTAEQVKELADKSGTFEGEEGETPVVTTDADEMNKSMPAALSTGTTTIASVEFNENTGVFTNPTSNGSYTSSKRWDLTDAEQCQDALTLSEVQALTDEFSVVFRAKLANDKKDTQGILFLSDDDDYWDNSLVLHAPGKTEKVYYEIRGEGSKDPGPAPSEKTTSPNTFSVQANGSLSTGSWHTIAITQSKDTFTYYIDGNKVFTKAIKMKDASFTIGSLFSNLTEETGFTATIGGVCKTEQATFNLNASMDWYQLYGTALTADEVAELSKTEEQTKEVNQMDAVMPKLDLEEEDAGPVTYSSAYKWSDVAPEKGADVWVVAGGSQLMGNDGAVANRSLYRLIDNAIRRTPTHRGTRLVDVAYDGHTAEDLVKDYDAAVKTYSPLAYMYLPDLSEVYQDGYQHSEEKVAAFKAQVQTWLDNNKKNNIKSILWTPLASSDATINEYIDDYAEAIRSLMTDTSNQMLFFDANRFMTENMNANSALVRNWFADEQQLTALGARDVAYAFCMMSNMTRIADSKKEDEIAQHDLRVSSDTCLFKGEYTRDLIESAVTVSGTQVTVDVSAIKEVYADMTNFSFKVLPFANASSYNEDLYEVTAASNGNAYTFTAPCTDPIIAVFGEKDGKTYRFADCTAKVEAADIRNAQAAPNGVYLDSLEVVGAAPIDFNAEKKEYDVTLYSYQRYVQILATAQDGLTIKVNGDAVESGKNSGLITVDETAKVTVEVALDDGTPVTYTLNLTRPEYPDIIITEVMTDAEYTTGNGGDDYEMVEIYNTTDRELNLKDYSLGHTKDYRYTKTTQLSDYPTFYFTGDNQVFGASAERSRSYTGINEITKYSTYWDGGEAEPDYIAFPAHSTMVIWVKFLDKTMTYDTLIADLKAAGEEYTLHVDGEPVVPTKEQLVVAEVPASLSSTISKINAVSKHAAITSPDAVSEHFYLANWTGEADQTSNWYVRGWLYILKAGAERDTNGSITKAGNDIVSASKFTKLTVTNKLSTVLSYNTERGMSLVKDEAVWDNNHTTGHTSDQQGYSNKTSFGAIEYWQKPYDSEDKEAAKVNDQTENNVLFGNKAKISLSVTDDTDVRYFELHVKKDGDTEWTVIKEDLVLKSCIENAGTAKDQQSFTYTYDLGELLGDASYYGYVLDGQMNKTEIGSEEAPCVIKAFEGGRVDVDMQIEDANGNPAAETITAEVTITIEQGNAAEALENAYDVMNGLVKAGTINKLNGKLTGTFTMNDGKSLFVRGLPDGAKYTVSVKVPEGYQLAEGIEKEITGNSNFTKAEAVKFVLQENKGKAGSLNISMSIADEKGRPDSDAASNVTITVKKGSAEEGFAASYPVMKGDAKVGDLALSEDVLTGVFQMKNGEKFVIEGLPDGAEYTISMEVADGYLAVSGTELNGTLSKTAPSHEYLALKAEAGPKGILDLSMLINDRHGEPVEKMSAAVEIILKKGNAKANLDDVYYVLNGSEEVGALTLKEGKNEVSGTILMKSGDSFYIEDLPEGAEYTATVTVPDRYELSEGSLETVTGNISAEEGNAILFEMHQREAVCSDLQIHVQIKERNGNPAADTVKAQVAVSIEKGEDEEAFACAYEVYSGERKVGILSLRDEKLSGVCLVGAGETLEVRGLPETTKYSVEITAPKGYSLAKGSASKAAGVIGTKTAAASFSMQKTQ